MATAFAWSLQGTSPTTIALTDVLRFAGAAFADPVNVSSYNDSTHVRSSGGSNLSSGNTPKNNKFISQTGGTGGKSQVDVGAGTVDLNTVTTANCALKIVLSDSVSFITSSTLFYSYDGITPATPAAGVDVRAAEQGSNNFTAAMGSGAALSLAAQSTPATSHTFYIIISKSPTAVGLKSDVLHFEAVVQ